jgi:hypothetical protein
LFLTAFPETSQSVQVRVYKFFSTELRWIVVCKSSCQSGTTGLTRLIGLHSLCLSEGNVFLKTQVWDM